MASGFSYADAFDRNIGWFTPDEQQRLRGKTIAIAGMGGVGGVHLLTLVRLGIANFRIADLDSFELANFNRQVGDAEIRDTQAHQGQQVDAAHPAHAGNGDGFIFEGLLFLAGEPAKVAVERVSVSKARSHLVSFNRDGRD